MSDLLVTNRKNYERNEQKNDYKYIKSNLLFPFLFGSVLLAKEKDDDSSNRIKINKSLNSEAVNQRLNFNFIADVVDETLPSIVHIEIKQNVMFGANSPSRYGSNYLNFNLYFISSYG